MKTISLLCVLASLLITLNMPLFSMKTFHRNFIQINDQISVLLNRIQNVERQFSKNFTTVQQRIIRLNSFKARESLQEALWMPTIPLKEMAITKAKEYVSNAELAISDIQDFRKQFKNLT